MITLPQNTYEIVLKLKQGTTILITGASKGIGEGLSRRLASIGANVIMVSRNVNRLKKISDDIKKCGFNVKYYQCDVTEFNKIGKIIDELQKLDVLINNASSNIIKPFLEYKQSEFDYLLNLNVKAYFMVAQYAVKKMLENKNIKSRGASVINISSIMGKVSPPIKTPRPQSIYTITKHAVEGLTKSLSVELAQHNIRVNSVCPTYVNTDLVKETMEDPNHKKYFLDKIPLGRIADIKDVENAVIYLCSDMCSMVTGTSLMIDGGWTAQ